MRAPDAAERAAWVEALRAHRSFFAAVPGQRRSAAQQLRQPAAVAVAAQALHQKLDEAAAAFAAAQLDIVVTAFEAMLERERKQRATLKARLVHAEAERQRLEFSVVHEAAAALGLAPEAIASALTAGSAQAMVGGGVPAVRSFSVVSSGGSASSGVRRRPTAGGTSTDSWGDSDFEEYGGGSADSQFSTTDEEGDSEGDELSLDHSLDHFSSSGDLFFDCTSGLESGSPCESPREIAPRAGPFSAAQALAPPWGDTPMTPLARRRALPAPAEREVRPSLWSVIKDALGKDITRITLPVTFNEPISALQMFAEQLEYSELLDRAAVAPAGSRERLCLVAAFAVSGYCSAASRSSSCKPFNPLERETYELVVPEKGFRFLAEKVRHNPLHMAAHAQGRGWSFWGESSIKTKFWGRSIQLLPEGELQVRFTDGDAYSFRRVPMNITNIILGPPFVDFAGVTRVVCRNTGSAVRLRFRESAGAKRQVRGAWEPGTCKALPNTADEACASPAAPSSAEVLTGAWDSHVSLLLERPPLAAGAQLPQLPPPTTRPLWRRAPPPEPPSRYGFTQFAVLLNELPAAADPGDPPPPPLPPTDSRLRPDQRLLEQGRYAEAGPLKLKLEEAQRVARKAAAESGAPPAGPRWFRPQPLEAAVAAGGLVTSSSPGALPHRAGSVAGATPALVYAYVGGYWEQREQRDWGPLHLPHIFGK